MGKKQKQIESLHHAITEQQKWIEYCEANGVSYVDGPCSYPGQGNDIRQADIDHLRQLENRLETLKCRRH